MQRRGGGVEGGDVKQSGPERDESQIGRAGGGQRAGLGVRRGVDHGQARAAAQGRVECGLKAGDGDCARKRGAPPKW